MKIAYLIAAHTDSTHLSRLISSLRNPDAYIHFFVHIDGKSDIEQFNNIKKQHDITILQSRIYTYWGGVFSVPISKITYRRMFEFWNKMGQSFLFKWYGLSYMVQ